MIHALLEQYFPWYNTLSAERQVAFQQRVQLLIKGRQFKGRGGFVVTNAHKVLIGAAAAWVTRGVDKFYYPHFNLITVYPEAYFKLIAKRYHSDRVQLPGAAVVSWHNLEEEYTTQPMPFQTLFHEFAHAVYFENVHESEGYADIDNAVLAQLQQDYAKRVVARLPDAAAPLVTATHHLPQQFFAGASEWFFTHPVSQEEEASSLYTWLQHVYQWPTAG